MNRKNRGFTLLELMIVIALTMILLAVTIPNYNKYRRNQAARSAAAVFQSDLLRAQSLAHESEHPFFFVFHNIGDELGYSIVEDKDMDYDPSNNMTPSTGQIKRVNIYNSYMGTTFSNLSEDDTICIEPSGKISEDHTTVPYLEVAGHYRIVILGSDGSFFVVWMNPSGTFQVQLVTTLATATVVPVPSYD